MSERTTVVIICDDCSAEHEPRIVVDCSTSRAARQQARWSGWRRMWRDYLLVDLCPRCAPAGAGQEGGPKR